MISKKMTSLQDFELMLLPVKNESINSLGETLLNNLSKDFPDKSLLEEQLQTLLSQSKEELEDWELSLDELESLSGRLGLVDAMVSSSILMVIATQLWINRRFDDSHGKKPNA